MNALHRVRSVLLVHPGLERLSALQQAFGQQGFQVSIARDLPTALLAVQRHEFDAAIIASRVSEPGDGYVLGGVLRRLFPRAFVAVLAPATTVSDLQAAINHGLDQLYEDTAGAEEIASSIAVRADLAAAPAPRRQVQ